jgi:hypothetical protein
MAHMRAREPEQEECVSGAHCPVHHMPRGQPSVLTAAQLTTVMAYAHIQSVVLLLLHWAHSQRVGGCQDGTASIE